MAAFDDCIAELGDYVDGVRRDRAAEVREFRWPGDPEVLISDLPLRVGPGANPGIVLRSDAFVELGNPDVGSCAALLWTDDPSLVADGRIVLVGPDVPEAAGASLPFGQFLLVGGDGLTDEDHGDLQEAQHVSDQLEGYMARSTSEYVWARVSHDAAEKGFTLEVLGRTLLHLVKAAVPKASAVEVLFVTASTADVRQLTDVAARAKSVGRDMVNEMWKTRGFDLECDLDCGSCSDQDVCDDIRDVIATARKAARETAAGLGK